MKRVVVFDDVLHARGERFPTIAGLAVEVHAHADEATELGLVDGDVVCMDYEMGREHRNGEEAVVALRAAGFGGRIVAMSSDPGCNLRMVAAGATEALPRKAMLGAFLVTLAQGGDG